MAGRYSASELGRFYLWVYVGLPLAYIVTGSLGLLLAVPPGYATAVFVPAGLAVGSFFLVGWRALVGTFVGSLFLNIWIGSYQVQQIQATTIIAGTVIAAASTSKHGSAAQPSIGPSGKPPVFRKNTTRRLCVSAARSDRLCHQCKFVAGRS